MFSTVYPDAPVGAPVQKIEALTQCAGEVKYTSDGRLPSGCLFGVPVIAYKAKATIESIDDSAALAMEGVEAFVSAADLKDIGATNSIGSEGYEIFAATTTSHVGQFLGMILADAQSIGERAVKVVKVTYKASDDAGGDGGGGVVATMHDERSEVGHVYPDIVTGAGTGAGAGAGAGTATGTMSTSGQKHFYMETQTTLAEPGERGTLMVTCACQAIGILRSELASSLAKLESKITVQNNRVGGAYGGKAFLYISIAIATSAAALKVNRPVLCQLDRNTDMISLGSRVPASIKMSADYTASGQITALSMDATVDGGYTKAGGNQVTSLNAYDIKGAKMSNTTMLTDTPCNSIMRAPGTYQGALFMEAVSAPSPYVTFTF